MPRTYRPAHAWYMKWARSWHGSVFDQSVFCQLSAAFNLCSSWDNGTKATSFKYIKQRLFREISFGAHTSFGGGGHHTHSSRIHGLPPNVENRREAGLNVMYGRNALNHPVNICVFRACPGRLKELLAPRHSRVRLAWRIRYRYFCRSARPGTGSVRTKGASSA